MYYPLQFHLKFVLPSFLPYFKYFLLFLSPPSWPVRVYQIRISLTKIEFGWYSLVDTGILNQFGNLRACRIELDHNIVLYSIGLYFCRQASTAGSCFCFGSIPSFFLELFLHWSPVAYWAPTGLGGSPLSVISFWLFILFTAFSRQEYWSDLPFSSPIQENLVIWNLPKRHGPGWLKQ